MPPRSRPLPIAAAVLMLAIGLTACGGEKDKSKETDAADKFTAPKAGQCVAKEIKDGNDRAPDFTSVVPCTEPHVFEILRTVPVPDKLLDTSSTKASLERRTELALVDKKETKRGEQLEKFVWPKCYTSVNAATWVDRMHADDKKPLTAKDISPRFGPEMSAWKSLTPPELWEKGITQAVCSIRYGQHTDNKLTSSPVTSPTDKMLVTMWMQPSFPARLHSCLAANGGEFVGCNVPHWVEQPISFSVDRLLGRQILRDRAISPDEVNELVAYCSQLFSSIGSYKGGKGLHATVSYSKQDLKNGRSRCSVYKSGNAKKNDMSRGFHAF